VGLKSWNNVERAFSNENHCPGILAMKRVLEGFQKLGIEMRALRNDERQCA
jgi:hypothetical protein